MKNKAVLKMSIGILCSVGVAVFAIATCLSNFTASAAGIVSSGSFYTNIPNSASITVNNAESGEVLAVFTAKTVGENTEFAYVKNYTITNGTATIDQLSLTADGDKQERFVAVVADSKDLTAYDKKNGTIQNTNGEETVTLPDGAGHSLVLKKITVTYDTALPIISDASLMQAADFGNSWITSSDKVTVKFKISDAGSGVDSTKIKMTLGGKNPAGAVTYDASKALYSTEFNVADFTSGKGNGDALFTNAALQIDASDCAGNAAAKYSTTLPSDLKYDNFSITVGSYVSDNTKNAQFGVNGNTLTLKFQTNIAVETTNLTVRIAGQSPTTLTSNSDDKMNWTATYKISDTNSLSNGAAIPFSIEAADKGNTKTVVNNESTKITYYTPIEVENLSFTSSNSQVDSATVGNKLTLTFQTQRVVDIANISIAGHSITPTSRDHTHWTAEYTLTESENFTDDDVIPFTFTAKDDKGNTATKTQDTTTEIDYFTPVNGTIIKVTSSSNSGIAKDGDTITMSFVKKTSSRKIEIKIAGISVLPTSSNNTDWTASYTLGKNSNEILTDNAKIGCSLSLCGNDLQPDSNITYYAPINITKMEINSGNSNSVLAKIGDTVTVSFQTGHPVTLSDTKIAGQAVAFTSINNDGMHWTGNYTINGAEVADNGAFQFTVTANDTASNPAVTKTNSDLSKQVTYYAPIQASNLKIASSNAKPLLAKDSDKITVSFQTTHPISIKSGIVAGKGQTDGVQFTSSDGMSWQGTYMLKNGDVADLANVPFSVTIADDAKNEEVSKSQSEMLSSQQVQYYAPVEVADLKLASNETNPNYSKNGSNITLSFTTQHEVQINSILIAGKTVSAQSVDNKNWKASYTLSNGDIKTDNANVSFNFAISDKSGNTATKSEQDTASVKYCAPIEINDLSYTSNNKQTNYAIDGDRIAVHFTTTHPVILSNQTVAGQEVAFTSQNNNGMNWIGTYTVLNGKTVDNTDMPFAFTANDYAGNAVVNKTNTDVADGKMVRYYAPIVQSICNCKFVSNNKKSGEAYAKNGDTVTLSFQTTHPVSLSQTQIAGQSVICTDVNGKHMNWMATYTVANNKFSDNTDIQYALSMNDDAGNVQGSRTQNDDITKVRYQAPIAISNLTFESNNDKTKKVVACDGNIVTAKFTTTHPVALSNTKVAGQNIIFSSTQNNGMDWTAVYTVKDGQIADNSNIALSLTANDASGNVPITKTEQDTTPVKYYEPIKVSELKITTDNENDGNKYARDGNTVTVSCKTNHKMSLSNTSIARQTDIKIKEINVSGNTYSYALSYQLHNGDISDLDDVAFRFSVDDAAGNHTVTKQNVDADVTNRIQYFLPITAKTIIGSNGKEASFAKNGDTVSLRIETNHNTKVVSSTILGRTASTSGNESKNLLVSYQINSADSSLKEGIVPFDLSVTDLAGNVLPINTVTDSSKVTYDRTAPIVGLTPDFSGFTNKKISYSVTFSDTNLGGQGLSFTVNGNEQLTQTDRNTAMAGTSFTKTIELDAEGEYNIAAKAQDRASNSAKSDVTAKVMVDKTVPKITSTKIDLSKTLAFQKGFLISKYFNIDDKYEKDIICKVTDNTGSLDWDINTPITTDGKKTIYLLVTDMAGNSSKALTYDLYIDGTAPKVSVKDSVTNKELTAGKEINQFTGKESLRISLGKLNIGSETEDKFVKLQLVNQKGELVCDLLKDGKKENGTYVMDMKNFGDYKLLAQAVDDVGNKTKLLEYPFVFQDQSVFSKYYENKPLFYTSIPFASSLIIAAGVFLILKVKKGKKSKKSEKV